LTREELVEWLRKRMAELEEELAKMREILSVLENQQVTVQSAETFTEEDLAALPWREHQSGRGEWVFADKAPKALVERLEKEGQVELGGYVYSLREGSMGKRFVSRRPASQVIRGSQTTAQNNSPGLCPLACIWIASASSSRVCRNWGTSVSRCSASQGPREERTSCTCYNSRTPPCISTSSSP
jgi:hypothetical protein